MKHRAPLVAAFLTALGLLLSLATPAAADTNAAAADYYVNATHSVTSHPMAGARMWGKSSRQAQFTIAKGKAANIYDSDGSARVYMTYPAWRARVNVSGSSYGPCHDGYSWSNPGLNSNGYVYKGFDNETCGDPGTSKVASPTVKKFSTVAFGSPGGEARPAVLACPSYGCPNDVAVTCDSDKSLLVSDRNQVWKHIPICTAGSQGVGHWRKLFVKVNCDVTIDGYGDTPPATLRDNKWYTISQWADGGWRGAAYQYCSS